MFEGIDRRRPALIIEVRVGNEASTIESRAGQVTLRPGQPLSPDIVLDGPPDAILGLLTGRLDPAAAASSGVVIAGDGRRIARLRPKLGPGVTGTTNLVSCS